MSASMSISELRAVISRAGLSCDGLLEKSDFVAVAREAEAVLAARRAEATLKRGDVAKAEEKRWAATRNTKPPKKPTEDDFLNRIKSIEGALRTTTTKSLRRTIQHELSLSWCGMGWRYMRAATSPANVVNDLPAGLKWHESHAGERGNAMQSLIYALFYKKKHPDAHVGLAGVELLEGRSGKALQHLGLALSYSADHWKEAGLHDHALQRIRGLGDLHRLGSWEKLDCAGPSKRSDAAFAQSDETLYVYGGSRGNLEKLGDLWALSLQEPRVWRRLDSPQPRAPPAVSAAAMCRVGGKLYLHGGLLLEVHGWEREYARAGDVWVWDVSVAKWDHLEVKSNRGKKKKKSKVPTRRRDHVLFSFDGALFVFGGKLDAEDEGNLGDDALWRCDLTAGGLVWTATVPAEGPRHQGGNVIEAGDAETFTSEAMKAFMRTVEPGQVESLDATYWFDASRATLFCYESLKGEEAQRFHVHSYDVGKGGKWATQRVGPFPLLSCPERASCAHGGVTCVSGGYSDAWTQHVCAADENGVARMSALKSGYDEAALRDVDGDWRVVVGRGDAPGRRAGCGAARRQGHRRLRRVHDAERRRDALHRRSHGVRRNVRPHLRRFRRGAVLGPGAHGDQRDFQLRHAKFLEHALVSRSDPLGSQRRPRAPLAPRARGAAVEEPRRNRHLARRRADGRRHVPDAEKGRRVVRGAAAGRDPRARVSARLRDGKRVYKSAQGLLRVDGPAPPIHGLRAHKAVDAVPRRRRRIGRLVPRLVHLQLFARVRGRTDARRGGRRPGLRAGPGARRASDAGREMLR
ncbi:hypothetical protein M885DRAFT_514992 [Pelagophyceae sp. CCMP2097]|nr:hypothetical protein M885DRAFT_514992 [Pelagophyceae sp. CCMP2097]